MVEQFYHLSTLQGKINKGCQVLKTLAPPPLLLWSEKNILFTTFFLIILLKWSSTNESKNEFITAITINNCNVNSSYHKPYIGTYFLLSRYYRLNVGKQSYQSTVKKHCVLWQGREPKDKQNCHLFILCIERRPSVWFVQVPSMFLFFSSLW